MPAASRGFGPITKVHRDKRHCNSHIRPSVNAVNDSNVHTARRATRWTLRREISRSGGDKASDAFGSVICLHHICKNHYFLLPHLLSNETFRIIYLECAT